MSTPNFQFSLSNHNDKNYKFITLGNDRIHRITNPDGLYEVLGYTSEIRHSGILPDEFIWAEYRQRSGAKSPTCLQAKIIDYLSEQLTSFTTDYALQLKEWSGCCQESGLMEKQACGNCLLHPLQKSCL